LIVAIVVVAVIALIIAGIVFLGQTDPDAAADRSAAEKALVSNANLGGGFKEVARDSFARSRGGLHVEGDFAECGTAGSTLDEHGRAGAYVVYAAQNNIALRVAASEVLIMDSDAAAADVVDAIGGSARDCVAGPLEEGASSSSQLQFVVSIQPTAAPTIGDKAAAFTGAAGIKGGAPIDASVDFVVAHKGRVVAAFVVIDTTGGMDQEDRDLLVTAMLQKAQVQLASVASS
jgi:hypothetical protein